MNTVSKTLLLALSLSMAACGGPADPKTPADTLPTMQAQPAAEVVGEPVRAELPAVPAAAVEAPASLTAAITAGNPNAQITQIATFIDAVFPGMAAFMTPQALMQQIEGIVGVVGLRGLDLNQPLHLLMLDDQSALVVATVANEADLTQSLEGTSTMMMLHEGYAAIGKYDALSKAGPYALSNLVNAPVPELPTVALHLGKIMRGPHAESIQQELKSKMQGGAEAVGAEITLAVMSNIETLSMSLDANPEGATVRLIGAGIGGELQQFLAKQRPADFSMLGRMGSGPWATAAGGRLDLTPFIPLLVKLGEAQAEPFVTQIAAQLGALNGEMGMALNMAPSRELVIGMELGAGQGLSALLDTFLPMMAKDNDLDFDGLKGALKLGSIKTRAGSLHELKLTPTTDKMKQDYGKSGVSAFFGIVADTMIVTFGPQAKVQARTLSAKSGALKGKGAQLTKVVEQAKSLNESFMVAFDVLSLQAQQAASDAAPVVLGIGFTADSFTGRLVVPTGVVKELAQGGF